MELILTYIIHAVKIVKHWENVELITVSQK